MQHKSTTNQALDQPDRHRQYDSCNETWQHYGHESMFGQFFDVFWFLA